MCIHELFIFYLSSYRRASTQPLCRLDYALTLLQWNKPTEPIYGPPDTHSAPPPGAPPGFGYSAQHATGSEKQFASNNPYGQHGQDTSEDEKLARQLQAEEDARGHGRPISRGAADDYYGGGGQSPYHAGSPGPSQGYGGPPPGSYGGPPPQQGSDQQQLPPRPEEKKKGLLGKLMGGGKHGQSSHGYPQQGYPQQQPGYGYPPGPPPQQYGGYPPQQAMYGQQNPPKKHGMGAGGAAALGVGGGLLGGMMLGEAMDGGDDGGDDGGWGGDDGGVSFLQRSHRLW